jgi:hypothetical protein
VAGAEAQQPRGQPRQVVRGVLLEERVVALDQRPAEPAPQHDAELVRAERRVHVDHVPAPRRERLHDGTQCRHADQPVLGIEEDDPRRQPYRLEFRRLVGHPVVRRDDRHIVAERDEFACEGAHRRRNAVDTREVDV